MVAGWWIGVDAVEFPERGASFGLQGREAVSQSTDELLVRLDLLPAPGFWVVFFELPYEAVLAARDVTQSLSDGFSAGIPVVIRTIDAAG